MSTLTKVLTILLTLASIFLCGIVVTYVSTATNYRLSYENLRQSNQAIEQKNAGLLSQMRENTAQTQQLVDNLNEKIESLAAEKNKLEVDLVVTKTSEAALQETVNGWASVVKGFKQTIGDMQRSLRQARDELDRTRTEHVDDRRRLNEIASVLDAKIVELDALETERRRLVEEKLNLEKMLREFSTHARPGAAEVGPITIGKERATPVRAVPGQVELQGLVTRVDLKNSLAGVNIGSADGVELGMKFYVTRGDRFVANILITDIEPEKAAGVLELVQQPPKTGDSVSNYL